MARVPFVPLDLAEPRAIVDAVRARRGGTLLELDRLLLHSPNLAEGWNGYLKQVRTGLSVDPKLRELTICAVAMLNGAEYEFTTHLPYLMKTGVTQAQCDALRAVGEERIDAQLFDERERAALQLAIEMTRRIKVSEATFTAAAQAVGSTQAVIELTAVIACYNMVSRFLVALDLHP
ncbi:MAG TPA: carboxymuconolactone decarboxylase family protein [Burkholderiales bacterium]